MDEVEEALDLSDPSLCPTSPEKAKALSDGIKAILNDLRNGCFLTDVPINKTNAIKDNYFLHDLKEALESRGLECENKDGKLQAVARSSNNLVDLEKIVGFLTLNYSTAKFKITKSKYGSVEDGLHVVKRGFTITFDNVPYSAKKKTISFK